MNKEFFSRFGPDLKNMIRLMIVQGGSESTYLDRAITFDQFCFANYPECAELTEALSLAWLKESGMKSPGVIHSRIAFLRGFAVYLNRIEKPAYVFPDRYFCSKSLFVPYIFTDEELSRLFAVIDDFEYNRDPFLPVILSTYFRLTYTCGLRPNEGRNLKRSDVNLNSGEIRVLNSKKGKSRIVVMSDDMLQLAKRYDNLFKSLRPESEYFFPKKTGAAYSAEQMQRRFLQFFRQANSHLAPEFVPRVRVYDLRHRFATAALNHWLDEKQNIQARLPYLQTYMGHAQLSSTAYYIHLLPENLVKSSGVDWNGFGTIYPDEEMWKE